MWQTKRFDRLCWVAIFIGGTVGTIISLISVISAYRDYDINTTMSLKKYTNVSDLKKRNPKETLNFNLHFFSQIAFPAVTICNQVSTECLF